MAYTPERPRLTDSKDQLRARIPGWDADLDPKDRPSVPKLRFDRESVWRALGLSRTPAREVAEGEVHRAQVPHPCLRYVLPAEGPVRPHPQGRLPQVQRGPRRPLAAPAGRRPGRRLGEPPPLVPDLAPGQPDHRAGGAQRVRPPRPHLANGKKRADVVHAPLDPILVAGPWLVAGGLVYRGLKTLMKRRRD